MPRARILVVDDSATVLEILKAALADAYDVETAADGEEALEQARRSPPDVIVTDNDMPGLDGFGLLRRLHADPATRAIPAIVLTSEDAADRPAAAGDVRPVAVLTKSMDVSPLLDAIRTVLDSYGSVPL